MAAAKRKQTKPRTAAPRAARKAPASRKWRLRFTACDVAHERDGFLRGRADPAFVLGVLEGNGGHAALIQRALTRVVIAGAPGLAPVEPPVELRGTLHGSHGFVLAIALEEDGGADVGRVYAALAEPARLFAWAEASEPTPKALDELAVGLSPWRPERVRVMLDDVDLAEACRTDEIVGATMVSFPLGRATRELRLRFASDDRANDWTMLIDLKVD